MTAPTMAVIQVLRLKKVLRVRTSNSTLARNPPSSAPDDTDDDGHDQAGLASGGCSAMNPATAPRTIQAMMLMGSPLPIRVTPGVERHV